MTEEIKAVSDEELLKLIDAEVSQSDGNFLDTSELSAEREKATLEYAMQPTGHLAPQGVSRIVASDTVEAIEGYTSVLSELLFDNNKLARLSPAENSPMGVLKARAGAQAVNHCLFKKNRGWEILNMWVKSGLMWKEGLISWEYVEDVSVTAEEFEEITLEALDTLLADPGVDIVGDLFLDPITDTYKDVRINRTKTTRKVEVTNVPPEALRISRDAESIKDAPFVGLEFETTRSAIRARYPDKKDEIEWDDVESPTSSYKVAANTDVAARRKASGANNVLSSDSPTEELEAMLPATLTKCWIYVDRDGDGIAELKRVIKVAGTILEEEDCDHIQLSSFIPFKIPHELTGLSMADMARPSTLATTAILRGFVENTYLTNYAPKIADPNTVDFSALQNYKPKSVIASIGNPNAAVASLPPEQISTGTVPLLQYLQEQKEQATGLSKAAQGLNDTLYVSGNSEAKVSQVQSAAQVRIQFIARRFMETGGLDLIEGVYKTMIKELSDTSVGLYTGDPTFNEVLFKDLPSCEYLSVEADVGDASNQTKLTKLQMIGGQVLPALRDAGAGGVVSPKAAAMIAHKAIDALGENPLDYIVDFTTNEFEEAAEKSRQQEEAEIQKQKQLEEKQTAQAMALQQANVDYTNVQSQNAIQDNLKQLMVALDKSYQEWAKVTIQAGKEQQAIPQQPSIDALYAKALALVNSQMTQPEGARTMVTKAAEAMTQQAVGAATQPEQGQEMLY